jgi:hypothetical protein
VRNFVLFSGSLFLRVILTALATSDDGDDDDTDDEDIPASKQWLSKCCGEEEIFYQDTMECGPDKVGSEWDSDKHCHLGYNLRHITSLISYISTLLQYIL